MTKNNPKSSERSIPTANQNLYVNLTIQALFTVYILNGGKIGR